MMETAKRPNILWICTDHQRFDTLGCMGNPYVHTPNLDALAADGMLFERTYCQSPVCTPSRSCFLTGRYPRTNRCRQNGQSIPKDEVLVTRILADNGYNCGLSGKLHLAPCHASVCHTTEERTNDGYSVFHWSVHPQDFENPNGGWANNEYHVWLRHNGQRYDPKPYRGSRHVQTGMPEQYHHTTWCTDRAIDFIESNAIHQNTWLFSMNVYDPHHPFDPPEEYLERYVKMMDEIPMPNFQPGELDNKNLFQRREYSNGAYNSFKDFSYDCMTEWDHKLVRASYWAMIDLIDKQVGRLIQTLKETGQYENTIVIFTSDHGEMLGDHGIYMKGPHFYDCSVRVPLIISWPGHIRPAVSSALVELTDLAPTLLDAVGLPPCKGMQGKSLWNLLCGKVPVNEHRQDVFSEYMNAMPTHENPAAFLTMLRDDRYKLVCSHTTDEGELYDMQQDPNETYNLWDDPEYSALRFRMLKRLCDRIALTCDPLPERQAGY